MNNVNYHHILSWSLFLIHPIFPLLPKPWPIYLSQEMKKCPQLSWHSLISFQTLKFNQILFILKEMKIAFAFIWEMTIENNTLKLCGFYSSSIFFSSPFCILPSWYTILLESWTFNYPCIDVVGKWDPSQGNQ